MKKKIKTSEIIHKEIVYLPMEVYTEPMFYWYNNSKDATIIISNIDIIIGSPTHELTYTLDEIKKLNVKDFIVK